MADDSVVGNLCGHDHGDGHVPMRDCSLLRRLEQQFDLRFDAIQTQIEGVSRRLDVLEVGVGSTARTERIRREDGRRLRRESRVDVSSESESDESGPSRRSRHSKSLMRSGGLRRHTSETSDGLEESVNESASIRRNNRMRDLRRGRGGDRVSDASSTDQGAMNVSNVQDRANVRIGETCHQDTMITGAVVKEVVTDTKQL
ncbi:hypothetical protein SASPL_101051 [Salvia splendens]|uniref:Uncharacterized protein n=1 Tax=Salvia splendens TaxID=180675 RepID=A0A8X9ABJ6_SALSN|nr:hypothetical protein SASPL_101051 [Salvia splendens]